jgi:iron(III) transport system ATP-binding protein
VSDQIIVMDVGLIAQAGTPHQLYEHPNSEFVAGFVGEAMLFDASAAADGSVSLGPLTVPSRRPLKAGAVKVAVRPEAWHLVAPGDRALLGTLLKHPYLVSFQELTVQTALGEIFVVSPDVARIWTGGDALALPGMHGVSVVQAGG